MNLYNDTDLVAITEHGILDVYERNGWYYIKVNTDDYSGYEFVHRDGVMTLDEAKNRFPEGLL